MAPDHYVFVNCDAAWDMSSCKAGLGAIARDHGGACIGGLAIPSVCASAVIAESKAVRSCWYNSGEGFEAS